MDLFDILMAKRLSGNGDVSVDPLSVTENGTYTAEEGHAYSPVSVNVPQPSGSISITENGTVDVTDYASAIVNVASGGGSGLDYESGTWSPTEDTISEFIPFTNQHSVPPAIVAIVSDANSIVDKNSVGGYAYINFVRLGLPVNVHTAAVTDYGFAIFMIRLATTSAITVLNDIQHADTVPSGDTTSYASYSRYLVRENGFYARTHVDTAYFRTKYSYKWVAIWAE